MLCGNAIARLNGLDKCLELEPWWIVVEAGDQTKGGFGAQWHPDKLALVDRTREVWGHNVAEYSATAGAGTGDSDVGDDDDGLRRRGIALSHRGSLLSGGKWHGLRRRLKATILRREFRVRFVAT